ncbi:DnaJ family domain-containing protein [Neobacillus mesonae]|uniref:DnaJ family domain-containing protein n=1 Tax=Neobacillus mesonae TaxID=1193713 RepID=UPI002040F8DF|nr:DnaJ family domain-containing protein [Neobacillus mesonae]MCM3569198.1 DUF1992 domain-containing protein [Neobacillus mesonae]
MDMFQIISEERIKKAYENGEFDHLPGYGRPLKLEDLSGIPEELRMAYKLLKNAGYSQEEGQIRQELMTIEDLIKKCDDSEERAGLQKRLNEKLLRFNQMMSKRGKTTNSSLFKNYEVKIQTKLK